jgi:peroxiredoxin Q/BCP
MTWLEEVRRAYYTVTIEKGDKIVPSIGENAPDFELLNDEGKKVKLSDFRGKKVILYFYPADFTSGCELQACKFRDSYPKIEDANAVVLGVSPDGVDSHRRFREAHGLPFHLLVDKDHAVANQWDATIPHTNDDGKTRYGIKRSQYIIDEEGKITGMQVPVKAPESLRLALEDLGIEQ